MIADAENESLAWLKAKYQAGNAGFSVSQLCEALPAGLKDFAVVVVSGLIDRDFIRPAETSDQPLLGRRGGLSLNIAAIVQAAKMMPTKFKEGTDGKLRLVHPSPTEVIAARASIAAERLQGWFMIKRTVMEFDAPPPDQKTDLKMKAKGIAAKSLRGSRKTIVDMICDSVTPVPLGDLAVNTEVNWQKSPYNSEWDSAATGINKAMRPEGINFCRHDSAGCIEVWIPPKKLKKTKANRGAKKTPTTKSKRTVKSR